MAFRPTFWPTVFTIPVFLALLGLGTWQVQRLHWKEDLIDKLQARSTAPAVPLPAAVADPDDFEYRRVTVAGRFLHDREMHLLNRSLHGNPGLHVVTPLVRADGAGAVLVDRGWVPFERRDPATRAEGQLGGEVTVEGILRLAKGQGLFVPDNEPDKNFWFYIDPPGMARAAGLDSLPPFYIMSAAKDLPGGFPIGHQWQLDIRNDHLQYAITWYGLAAALLVIYVAYHRRQPERPPSERS